MWRNGNTLGEKERKRIAGIVRRYQLFWSCILFAADVIVVRVTIEAIIKKEAVSPFFPITIAVLTLIILALARRSQEKINILKAGTFIWIDDVFTGRTGGGRYSRPLPKGREIVYHTQQFSGLFRKGNRLIGVRFHPDTHSKWYGYHSITEPIAYKV